MNEATLTFGLTMLAILITMWSVCRRCHDRRTGGGTGSDSGSVRDGLERAEDRNQELAGNNRRAADAVRRADERNQDAQNLVSKARDILSSAQHTD